MNHSGGRMRAQLSHHVPHQFNPWYRSVDSGIALLVPPYLQQLHYHDLQAASNYQKGLLHGA